MPASAELQGMERLQKRINAMGRKGARAENKALRESGEIVAEAARSNVKIGPEVPHLKDHIEVSRVKTDSFGHKHIEVGPEGNTQDGTYFYSRFLEFGTVHAPAHPFLEPAAEESRDEVIARMKQVLKDGLK